VSGLEFEPLEF